jgi:hypothetical protein
MISTGAGRECFEVSPRFRHAIEARISRLETDAAQDEARILQLVDIDHIGRQMRLVAAQRDEATRMRSFLDRTRTRPSSPPGTCTIGV